MARHLPDARCRVTTPARSRTATAAMTWAPFAVLMPAATRHPATYQRLPGGARAVHQWRRALRRARV